MLDLIEARCQGHQGDVNEQVSIHGNLGYLYSLLGRHSFTAPTLSVCGDFASESNYALNNDRFGRHHCALDFNRIQV